LISEIESFIDRQAPVEMVKTTLPSFLMDSIYNLRFINTKGVYKSNDFLIEKIFIINADPKKPTTFEVSFPWNTKVGETNYNVSTKFLGEYRFSKQKIDLHFFSKNKINIKDEVIDKNVELTFEGKGYFGSRLGFFTTLASKEDWFGFVGDLEWTKKDFKLNVPKFSIHHDFLFDLYSFRPLQGLSKNYSQSTVQGDLRFYKTLETTPVFDVNFQSKSNAKINLFNNDKNLFLKSATLGRQKEFNLKLDNQDIIAVILKDGVGKYSFNDSILLNGEVDKNWFKPILDSLGYINWLRWGSLLVSREEKKWFNVERKGEYLDFSNVLYKDLPPLNFRTQDSKIIEWSATTVSEPIDGILELLGVEFFGVPGFRYNSSILMKNDILKFKSQWKGSVLPVLARSSCRSLIQDKPELKFLLSSDLVHTVEFERVGRESRIISWIAVMPGTKVMLTGSWSNDPIGCSLKISQQVGNKKAATYEILLN